MTDSATVVADATALVSVCAPAFTGALKRADAIMSVPLARKMHVGDLCCNAKMWPA